MASTEFDAGHSAKEAVQMNDVHEPPEKAQEQTDLFQEAANSRLRFEQKEALRAERVRQKELRRTAKLAEAQRRREQKLQSRMDRQEYRRRVVHSRHRRWFSFFTKWFFIGLVLIAASVSLTLILQPQAKAERGISILSGVLSTVGIALMVGAVFDFSKNSEAFVKFITNILSDIIMSKTFLTTLSDQDKETALMLILTPTNKQLEQYSNINAFFKKRIGELTTMFDINFKTNVILDILAYRDPETGSIWCKTVLTQTIYKIQDNFQPVEVIFEKPGSKSTDVYILPPTGKSVPVEGTQTSVSQGGINCDKYVYEIPKELEQYDHLTIKRTMLEPGQDHWINYYWQSLTPYEGIVCTINCADGLTVKDYMIFDNKAYYRVDLSKDQKRLSITSSQWLDTDTGFVATISDTAIPQ